MSIQITRDELLKFEHTLHCKLRGAKGIKLTGLPALNEIENILLFKFIEENEEVNLPNDIKFTSLCEKYATDDKIKEDKKIPNIKDRNCYKLWDTFYNANNEDFILGQYFKNDFIRKYIKSSVNKISAFTEAKKQDISQTIQELFNLTYNKFKGVKFDSTLYDMFGSAHEQFKTDATGNSGKTTEQHFTPQDIKKLIVEEVKPKAKEIIYEPCAGSGGMIHTADQYVRNNEPKEYKKFKKNIYANECNAELIKPLMINMLLHNIPVDNIHEQDSLSCENITFMKEKADTIMTNYPFGMSNTIDLNDYKGVEDYWKILTRGKGKKSVIKNSSGQFVLHIYHSLKKNGRTGFVSDRGIIYNGDSSTFEGDIRKFLVENGNLYKIILLPTGIFPYTPFATCVIFYKKGETTKTLEIYEGKFKDIKAKKGLYVEDIPIKTFTLEELRKNGYCFKTEEKIDVIQKGWVKLGDVVEIHNGRFNSQDMDNKGDIPFFSCVSNNPCGLHSEYSYNFNEDYIIFIGNGGSQKIICSQNIGMGKSYIHNGKVALRSGAYLFKVIKNILIKYIYYYLWIIRYNINFSAKYSGNLGVLSLEQIKDIQIPSLSLSHQEEIVSFLDEQFKLYDINLLSTIIKDIPLFDLLINKKYDMFADAMHIIYRKLEADAMQQTFSRDMKSIFNLSVHSVKSKEYKLGEVVEFQNGKALTKDAIEPGIYPVIGGGQKPMGFHNKYNTNENSILCSSSGAYAGFISKYNTKLWASDCFSINIKNNILLNNKYLYYILKLLLQENIYKLQSGSGQPHIYSKNLENILIPIPSLEDQEKIIKQIESIESTQTDYKTYGNVLQGQIDMLNVAIKNLVENNSNILDEETLSTELESENESEPEVVQEVKPKKSEKKVTLEPSAKKESDTSKKGKKNTKTVTLDV